MSDLTAEQKTEALTPSWVRPEGASFEGWMEGRVARHTTRKYDWDALKFQADYDPKYRRAQMRYVGTGGTGVSSNTGTVPAENFTFSTMVLPAGHEGPLHIHYDVEEIFFVLRGTVKMIAESVGGKEKWEVIVGERDLISWPPGVYRGEINIGDEEALLLVMLGAAKPQRPTYRPEDPLSKLKR
jgi:mannose-6-phosphate isomerase-like protein (cupin superfamily)